MVLLLLKDLIPICGLTLKNVRYSYIFTSHYLTKEMKLVKLSKTLYVMLNKLFIFISLITPYSALIAVHGVRDLFWMPIEQYRKDGRIIRGLQRGAASFGTSTASAALELSNRLVQAIQVCTCMRIHIHVHLYTHTHKHCIMSLMFS